MRIGTAMHRIAARTPKSLVAELQLVANRNPRGRRMLARLSAPMRHGEHRIADGPARGYLMDVAGSRPSYLLGTAEPEVVDFLRAHVRPGDLVLDLGANVGYFTLIAAALTGPAGRVVAYEPIPSNAEALRRNVDRNRLQNVEVVEAAISGRDGFAEISVAASDQQATLVAPRDGGVLRVRTISLDSEAARLGAPSVIKCDIEGAEYEAFARASAALAGHPAILCEVHRMQEGDEDRLEAILTSHGYRTESLDRAAGAWTSHVIAVGP